MRTVGSGGTSSSLEHSKNRFKLVTESDPWMSLHVDKIASLICLAEKLDSKCCGNPRKQWVGKTFPTWGLGAGPQRFADIMLLLQRKRHLKEAAENAVLEAGKVAVARSGTFGSPSFRYDQTRDQRLW